MEDLKIFEEVSVECDEKGTMEYQGGHSHGTIGLLDAAEAPTEPTLHGSSVGHWDDSVLKVRTDKFGPHRMGALFGVASSPSKTLVETFSLNEDGKSLVYTFEMKDPEMMTEPLKGEFQYAYRPDIEYESLPCDLENSRQYLHD